MRIDEYNLTMESENTIFKYSKISSTFRKYKTPDKIEIIVSEKKPQIDEKTLQKLKVLIAMLEKLTGRKLKIYLPEAEYEVQISHQKGQDVIEFESEQESLDVQYLNFSSQGFVKTKDGRLIDFSVQLKEFQLSYYYLRSSGKVVDPLVLELKGGHSELKTVEIDLNFDGELDKFYIGGNLGFLVYDKNGNGKVDSARELFGPSTGDGFKELALLDGDGDNWIDEDDLEFLKLKIWTLDENGREKLVGLLDLKVGAIFLGNVTTPFEYEDYVVRKTGVYLTEDGLAGTIRQIDVKV
ncbi:MAG: hypothetical protein ABDH59_01335 [Fervidobacterium sp.]